jgi:hypothetical protein
MVRMRAFASATQSLRAGGARSLYPTFAGGMVATNGRLPAPFTSRTIERRLDTVKHVFGSPHAFQSFVPHAMSV